MPYGLTDTQLDQIRRVLAETPHLERAVLFGSRAKGTHKPGSDVDLALMGDAFQFSDRLRLDNELDDLNLPVSQLNTTWNGIMFGSSNTTGLISVQALYITPVTNLRPETLWVVDTGRPTVLDSSGAPTMPYAQPGGPKIIGINLFSDTVYATYTFPASVHYPDSYINDIRFDLRTNITQSGQGVA